MATTKGDQSARIADLLRQLQEAGAEIREGGQQGQKIKADTLSRIGTQAGNDWTAWVAWPKQF